MEQLGLIFSESWVRNLIALGTFFIALAALLLSIPWRKRPNAVKYGTSTIFEDNKVLTFKEIAEKWNKTATPKEHFSVEKNMSRLVSSMWLGKFEDKDGNSKLKLNNGMDTPPSINRGEILIRMRVQSAPRYESMFSNEPAYIIEEFRTKPDKLWHRLANL